jgi:hypothetical protein
MPFLILVAGAALAAFLPAAVWIPAWVGLALFAHVILQSASILMTASMSCKRDKTLTKDGDSICSYEVWFM